MCLLERARIAQDTTVNNNIQAGGRVKYQPDMRVEPSDGASQQV